MPTRPKPSCQVRCEEHEDLFLGSVSIYEARLSLCRAHGIDDDEVGVEAASR